MDLELSALASVPLEIRGCGPRSLHSQVGNLLQLYRIYRLGGLKAVCLKGKWTASSYINNIAKFERPFLTNEARGLMKR